MEFYLRIARGLLLAIGCVHHATALCADVRHTAFLFPGTAAEAGALIDGADSSVNNGSRVAATGKGWAYRVTVPATAQRCELSFKATGNPVVKVTNSDGVTIPSRREKIAESDSIRISLVTNQPLGNELRFRFDATEDPIAVRNVQFDSWLPDRNGDGLSDAVEVMMKLSADEHAKLVPRPTTPHTGFFFAQPYDATMAVPTDVVQLYNGSVAPDPNIYSSWAAKGFGIQAFLHSRYPDPEGGETPAAFQTDRNGRPLVVIEVKRDGKKVDLAIGPITPQLQAAMIKQHGEGTTLEAVDHYKVPTQARIEQGKQCFSGALAVGAQAVCFDEPEFWADAGYSAAFRQEWQAKYGTAWQPPHSSVDARYRAEQLKAFLLQRWVKSTLEDVQERTPSAPRMIALHSPINYYRMRMATPHYRLIDMPAVQEVVAEVWNDPFELSYLEYSSFYHLVRGTEKRLWFMMDPWGDSPAMSLDFYRRSYGNNLLAALMFPQIDTFQPLIWPDRLYGHVPKDYEIIMNTVVGALSEMWRYPDGQLESGSRGIATFIADSMAWQRAEPSPSDFDGFDGLTLPLVGQGVPVEALSLDRAAEPGYLDGFKCLFVSYDYLKPTEASQNRAIAEWTQRGGTVVCFGGTDAYNELADSWWKRAGRATPLEDLFAQMGLEIRNARLLTGADKEIVLEAASDGFKSTPTNLHVPLMQSPGKGNGGHTKSGNSTTSIAKNNVRGYPVTLYGPPPKTTPLYRITGETVPLAWEAPVGKGRAIFVGVAPSYFKSSAKGPAWIRALAQYAFERAGEAYREQPHYIVRRGPYTAVRTLDQPYELKGRFVDLLSPSLAILDHSVIAPQECAFLGDANETTGMPRLLATSGRLRAYYEVAGTTSFLVQAPTRTDGVARVWCGSRQLKHTKAFTALGASVEVKSQVEGNTLRLNYPNDADGVVVQMQWEPNANSTN
jgi:hypothetical protein